MTKVGILASGEGTNLQVILDACVKGVLKERIEPVVVISNNQSSKTRPRCEAYNAKLGENGLSDLGYSVIHHHLVQVKDYEDYYQYDKSMCDILKAAEVSLVLLAGYNRLLIEFCESDCVIRTFDGKIINIHPSLLPAFPGMNSVKKAFDYGVKITGCTIHWVDKGMDTGRIIEQKSCRISSDDTLGSLLKKVHSLEHVIFVDTLVSLYLNKKI